MQAAERREIVESSTARIACWLTTIEPCGARS
jgi:hypothetical protein